MKPFPQPGAITLLVVILITCSLLFLLQKMTWFVVPFLLALILYYCLRPVMQGLVVRGMRHETAAKTVWLLLQLISVAAVFFIALLVMAKAGTWHSNFNRYIRTDFLAKISKISSLDYGITDFWKSDCALS